ncbi:PKD domain-containing protein, partial [Zoogloea sp.]|uniref:PKD domain-containing protein n=1 Tax=Zoogloea sp. TaxID=49181 RepID=UPI0026167D81
SGSGIFQRVFGDTAELPRSGDPALKDIESSVVFGAADAITPQLIDNDLVVSNNGTSFSGGSLWVYFTSGADSNDALAIRSVGFNAGQIGVNLNEVSFGGVVIGTVAGGTGGAPLVVSLSGAASPAAIQALAENVTYQYSAAAAPAGTSDRYVAFRLFDNSAAASDPTETLVRIQDTAPASALALVDVVPAVTVSETAARGGVLLDGAVQLNQGAGGLDGAVLTASFSANGRSSDQLGIFSDSHLSYTGSTVSYDGTTIGTVAGGDNGTPLTVTFNANASAERVEAVIEHLAYQSDTQGALPSRTVLVSLQDASSAVTSQSITVNILPEANGAVPLFDQARVNTYVAGEQSQPAVATLADGSYVVVWQSYNQDGNAWGVFGQHFTAAGVPVGLEFAINSYIWNSQDGVSVAALSGGGYVVAWRSEAQDGSSGGVFAQVFSAQDAALGDEFRVTASTVYDQTHAAVIGLADGGFVVAFADQTRDGSGYGTYAQRYDASGTPIGSDFLVNTYVPYDQYLPALSALKDDPSTSGTNETGFVAVWRSLYQDGSGWGIFGQRFDASGNKVGAEFQVNTNASGNQYNPTVVTLTNGDFVVLWSDESDYSLLGQRYTAGGVAVGGAFMVSTPDLPSNQELWPHATALSNGGFVVAWDSYSGLLNDYIDVWGQQFDATGAKVDGPVRLSQTSADAQHHPVVAGLANGNFVAAWASNAEDVPGQGGYGVFQRLFGTPGSVARQENPQLLDLESSVTLNENAVNATPQLIDSGLRVIDEDSANFAGGTLRVSVLTSLGGNAAYDMEAFRQDSFTILHEGNGAGQVGVSGTAVGSTIRFGGVAVGTIASDGQGWSDLVIVFNSNATAAIVERVAERLAYTTSSSAPVGRVVEVAVSDGDGGQSVTQTINLNITPQTDGAVALLPGDTQVNTYTDNTQAYPTAIHLAGPNAGEYVIVWQSYGQDSDQYGVYAQRYNLNGAAIGAEFQVSSATPGNQGTDSGVRAAALTDGGFVVAWESSDDWGRGVFAQRFDASGNAVGSEWRVNPVTTYEQLQPAVVGLANGGFAIAYSDDTNADGNSYGTVFQRYDANGLAQGSRVLINDNPPGGGTAFTTDNQSFPQLSALANGGFVAVWHSYAQDGSGWGTYARVFDASGAPTTDGFRVNSSTLGHEARPDVTTLSNGDFVVVWQTSDDPYSDSYAIMLQRFTAGGVPVGSETLVNNGLTFPSSDAYPHVTALDTGGFVVSWESDDGWGRGYYVQQYDTDGHKVDGPLRASQAATSDQTYGDVAGLAGGRFVVTWSSSNQEASGWGVYQNVFGPAGSPVLQAAPVISDMAGRVTYLENTVNAAPQLIDAAVGVFDSDSITLDGGVLTVSVISGYSSLNQDIGDYRQNQDNFSILSEGTGAGQVNVSGANVRIGTTVIGSIVSDGQAGHDLVIQFNAAATQPFVEHVLERLAYRNPSTDPVASRQVSITLSDGDGATSTPTVIQINVTAEADGALPLGSPESVNTYKSSEQMSPATATLADGGYVVTWQSNGEDGWDYGIFGQRYAANGTPVGNEFKVSAYTPGSQSDPAVAALSDGGWVVTYTDEGRDGSGYSVWAQRFDAAGRTAGAEFRVNTSTSGSQLDSSVSALGDGFVVAWRSDGERNGEYYDVFFQRYDHNGNTLGAETRANTPISGNPYVYQYEPDITALANGNFVVAWRSEGQDGSNSGVYAQLFDGTSGNAIGAEFQLNQYTVDYQYYPRIAAVGSGFVATWISRGQDGSSDGIYARGYDGAGNPVDNEFRVNESSYNYQISPDIAATGDGGFVITWRDSNTDDILAQKFDGAGNRVDGELNIGTTGISSDDVPAVAGLAGNAFAIVWQGQSDGSGYGVFQRVVGDPGTFAHSAAPQIVDLASSVTFQENAINAAPQVIDAGIGLFDPDSANFNGGRLDVSFITTYGDRNQFNIPGIQAQDQLGVRNEGMGEGQIGVSGSTISYGGTAIGTLIGNGVNGGSLIVSFNANATPEAVENLIENLTYQNFLSNPEPTRTVSVRLSDGSGGVTAPQSITLNIAANPDGAVLYGAEQVVSRFALTGNQAGEQGDSSIAQLADGGYVVAYTDWSGSDGSSYAVFARRYDANDNAVGDPFQVNIATLNTQDEPTVVGLSGGGFAVIWTSNDFATDTSGDGVFMRRYLPDGSAAPGGEVLVNTSMGGNQYQPAVSQSSDGGFIVAWYSDGERDGIYYDIYLQHFDATGQKVGGEVRASLPIAGELYTPQSEPSIALLNNVGGDFVVTWTDGYADGSGNGIFAQRFNADGSPIGARFQVNTYIDNSQSQSSVAALNDGGFVVVWTSYGEDTWGYGVYGQRYDALGNTLGAEFRVNYNTANNQLQPSVTGLTNGGFVVSWDDQSSVWLQQYDAGGRAIDSQIVVNDISTETTPDIVATADGGFLVSYQGYRDTAHGGNNSTEVLVQRYSNTAPNVSDVNVTGDEDSDVALLDTLFAAGFTDAEGQALASIRIVTLPGSGTLSLHGVAVQPGQEIGVADLAAGALIYHGNADYAGADLFRWTGSDGNTYSTQSVFTNITLRNVNDSPRLEAGADRVAQEGHYFAQGLTLGDPDIGNVYHVTVDWGYSVNGTPVTSSFTTPSKSPTIDHVFPDNGSYHVSVTVDDQQGQANSVATDSFTVVVDNVAPTQGLGGDNTVEQGHPYTLTLGGVSDPGADIVTQYAIDWGDGSPPQVIAAADLPANRQVVHTYAAAGDFTIETTLTDEDGSFPHASSKALTVAPPAEVIVVDAGLDSSVGEGLLFTRSISFTDPADQDPAGRSATINWGDGTPVETLSLGAGQFSFNISHRFADDRAVPVTVDVSVTDNGFQTASDSFTLAVTNVAPSLAVSGPGAVAEGSPYTVTLGAVQDVAADTVSEYRIDWGDGSAPQVIAAADLPANRQVTHTYADGNISGTARQIGVTLVDEDGTHINAGTQALTVYNVAPTVSASGAVTIAEGSDYTLTVGPRVDPGADTPTLYRIDWGDGSTQNQYTPTEYDALVAGGGVVHHTFADGTSNPTITVRVFDEDGEHIAASHSVSVTDVAPTASLTGAATTPEGSAYALGIGAILDPGADTVSEYRIVWGDETTPGSYQTISAAQLALNGGVVSHTYADGAASYSVQVSAQNEEGLFALGTKAVDVLNVAPTASLSGPATVDEGSVYTLTVGAITDPGTDTRSGYSIAWGDGSTDSFTPADWATAAGSFTHTYADGASAPTITVSTTDEDGTTVLGTQAVTVNNVAPAASLSGASAVDEGSIYTLTVGAITDPGTDTRSGYTIAWGDGSTDSFTPAQWAAAAGSFTHTYADGASTPTITVSTTDEDGTTVLGTQAVAVANVAPSLVLDGAASTLEGATYQLTLTGSDVAGSADPLAYSIAWGDGSTQTVLAADLPASGIVSHVFTDDEDGPANATARQVTVTVTDSDGGSTEVSKTVTVNNVAPTIEATGAASATVGVAYTLNLANY